MEFQLLIQQKSATLSAIFFVEHSKAIHESIPFSNSPNVDQTDINDHDSIMELKKEGGKMMF